MSFSLKLQIVKSHQRRLGEQAKRRFSGNYIKVVTPVPIPNTVVKHFEPMIVLQA